MKSLNYYQTLGVDQTATTEQIKSAYKKMASKFHPDVMPGLNTTDMMSALNEARDTLLDPERRRRYDEELASPQGPSSSYESERETPPQPESSTFGYQYVRPQSKIIYEPPAAGLLARWVSKCMSWEVFLVGMFFNILTYESWTHNIPGASGLYPDLALASWLTFWLVPKTVVRKVIAKVRKNMSGPPKTLEPKK